MPEHEQKHTQGPWEWGDLTYEEGYTSLCGADGEMVFEVAEDSGACGIGITDADAELIRRAPEMDNRIAELEAALAGTNKATVTVIGEAGVCLWCGHGTTSFDAARVHDCSCKAHPMWHLAASFASALVALRPHVDAGTPARAIVDKALSTTEQEADPCEHS